MRQALEMALDWIKKQPEETPESKYDVDTRYVVLRELEAALAQPGQKSQLLFEIDGEMLTASQMMGIELFNFQQATGCDTAAEFLAQPEQDQDEVDIRSRLYQRIHELETQLAQPEQDWIERERAVGYREGHQNALKQMAQPEQEPVAWAVIASNTGRICQVELNFAEVEELSPKWVVPLYTTPPQRKPLTEEQIIEATEHIDTSRNGYFVHITRAIEAAHGIKE